MNVRGIVVDESGRVGIGDAVLGQELEVAGDARIGGRLEGTTDGDSEFIGIEGQSFVWVLGVQNEPTSGESDFFIGHGQKEDGYFHIQTDGKVGIGTTNPVTRLDVDGGIRIGNEATPAPGMIRWTGSDFEGFDGTVWWSLTTAKANAPDGMAYIPAGEFQMGDNYGEGESNEVPVHVVSISAFYMDKFEVSNQEMAAILQWAYDQEPPLVSTTATNVMNTEGSPQELIDLDDEHCEISFTNEAFVVDAGRSNFPCVEVSWYGALAYCNYRSDREGLQRCISFTSTNWVCDFGRDGYRLPTEAEWRRQRAVDCKGITSRGPVAGEVDSIMSTGAWPTITTAVIRTTLAVALWVTTTGTKSPPVATWQTDTDYMTWRVTSQNSVGTGTKQTGMSKSSLRRPTRQDPRAR